MGIALEKQNLFMVFVSLSSSSCGHNPIGFVTLDSHTPIGVVITGYTLENKFLKESVYTVATGHIIPIGLVPGMIVPDTLESCTGTETVLTTYIGPHRHLRLDRREQRKAGA